MKSFEVLLKQIGRKLRLLRHAKDNEKIFNPANAVGISTPTLSKIENGIYDPVNLYTLFNLASYYNIELYYLFSSDDNAGYKKENTSALVEFLIEENNALKEKVEKMYLENNKSNKPNDKPWGE